jgi:hypothetical protein
MKQKYLKNKQRRVILNEAISFDNKAFTSGLPAWPERLQA